VNKIALVFLLGVCCANIAFAEVALQLTGKIEQVDKKKKIVVISTSRTKTSVKLNQVKDPVVGKTVSLSLTKKDVVDVKSVSRSL